MENINFLDDIKKEIFNNKSVIIDFWAPWCLPCKTISNSLDHISNEFKDIKIIRCNIDENPDLATEFKIKSIPTLIYIKDGEVKDITIGALPENVLRKIIKEIFNF